MKQHQHAVFLFLSAALIPLVLLLSSLYYYDPFQLFHRSYIDQTRLHPNMRQQAAGVINHFAFDSVVLGSSMLHNTSADEASRLLGGRFVNISTNGADLYERHLILSYALEKRPLKTVLFSLDPVYYIAKRKGNRRYDISSFAYLYDHNPMNNFKAYLNERHLSCLLQRSTSHACLGEPLDLDRPNAWFALQQYAPRFGGVENWRPSSKRYRRMLRSTIKKTQRIGKQKKPKKPPGQARDAINDAINYVAGQLISLVKAYPQTHFMIVSPPYYRAKFAFMAQLDGSYEQHLAVIGYMSDMAEQYPNLRVFGYENQAFVDDIANYVDVLHYSEKINSLMLQQLAQGKAELTPHNVDDYLRQSQAKALAFDLVQFGQKLQAVVSADSL